MKRFISIMAVCLSVITLVSSCQQKLTVEEATAAVLSAENERLPLIIQEFKEIADIRIDSLHMLIKDEPMEGFLYTTCTINKSKWNTHTHERDHYTEEKQIVIQVTDIIRSKERKGYVEWRTNWNGALYSYRL